MNSISVGPLSDPSVVKSNTHLETSNRKSEFTIAFRRVKTGGVAGAPPPETAIKDARGCHAPPHARVGG